MDIKQNLQVLKDFLKTLPESQINLDSYGRGCGAVFCAAGWLPHIPHFRQLGVKADDSSAPILKHKSVIIPDRWMTPIETLEKLFGPDAYRRLFTAYYRGLYDAQFGELLPDKQLALTRIDKALEAFQ